MTLTRPDQHHHHRLPAGDADSDVLHGHHQRAVRGPVGADFACSWRSWCMPMFGFSLNMIVLFAFLLALGIVVDDAIVVIENTHRLLHEHPELSTAQSRQIRGR
ncbi:MAG: efflux RND transporter permease subunit [Hymenobacter sp.]